MTLPCLYSLVPLAALKVLLVCFERQLGPFWYRLSLQVREMASRKVGVLAYWDFIDFIVRTRIPLFVLLRPFIQCKVRERECIGVFAQLIFSPQTEYQNLWYRTSSWRSYLFCFLSHFVMIVIINGYDRVII